MIKHKVFAYITHNNRLLVFRHPAFPETGIQVPAGTIEANEHPEAAVLREWNHGELHLSDGTPGPIVFAFFWAPLPDGVPQLIANHGVMLPQLIAKLFPEIK